MTKMPGKCDGNDPPNVEKRTQKFFLNWGQRNQESVGRLFVTFFMKLQSVEFLWREGLCVSVLHGLWISKIWKITGDESIMVEDFTDVSQKFARWVNDEGAKKIYSSINRTVEDIFEFLNGKITGTHLRQRLFGQKAVVEPHPPVRPLNEKIAGTDLRDWLSRQKAVVEPPHPVRPLNEKIAGIDLRDWLSRQKVVVEPPPPVPPLNEKMTGTDLRDWLSRQKIVVEPPPLVRPLNEKIAGTDLRHWLSCQQAVVEPRPLVPPLNGNIAGTHLKHRLFGQQAVVPPARPLNVYPQQPHNNYRNGFSGLLYNKRVYFGSDYRAVEGSGGHKSEEERYEDLRGKQNRYVGNSNGFEEYREIPRFGIHNNPLDVPYRQVSLNGGENGHFVYHRHDGRLSCEESMSVGLWQDYSRRIGPPPPQPPSPYGRVSYENFGPQNVPHPYFGRLFY